MRATSASVAELDAGLDGRIIMPYDTLYDEARTMFYGGHDLRPAVIVRAGSVDDVVRTIAYAQDAGRELAVRSGGHSGAGHSSTDGGVQLDLSDLRALDIDVEGRTAWVGSGLTAREYTVATGAHGLATGFGDAGTVGIGGITLGGGVGFLVRKYGLTIDDLLAADIVTADGRVRRVDAQTEPDLFWAIRGGGGNFGVATRFRFRLHPVDTVMGGMLFLPATPDVVEGFMHLAAAAPDELSTIANVMTAPPIPLLPEEHHGSLIVMAFLVYAGDVEAGERAVAPFKALATPLADAVRPMAYPEMYPPDPEGPKVMAYGHNGFVDELGSADYVEILERLQQPSAPIRAVQLRTLGGAMAEVPDDATAFAHRARKIMVNLGTLFMTPDGLPAAKSWVEETAAWLHGDDHTSYVNFLGDEGPERVRQAYPGDTWDRLREIKRQYDPDNLFRMNQNIPPADG